MRSESDGLLYPTVSRIVAETPWAVLESTYQMIREIVRMRAQGQRFTEAELQGRLQAAPQRQQTVMPALSQTVAVIPLYGVLLPKASLFSSLSGAVSLAEFSAMLQAAVDSQDVTHIVIDVDSPGGSVDLVPETAALVRAACDVKPVTAVANCLCASAAYHIACQATELVVTPSGTVGSIGVFCGHQDFSKFLADEGVATTLIYAGKYKVDGNQYEPLSDTARASLQAMVDDCYRLFVDDVAQGRGTTPAAVMAGFGEGRLVRAAQAVREGMADTVETFDGTINRILGGRPSRQGISARAEAPQPQPAEVEDDSVALASIAEVLTTTTTSLKEATE